MAKEVKQDVAIIIIISYRGVQNKLQLKFERKGACSVMPCRTLLVLSDAC